MADTTTTEVSSADTSEAQTGRSLWGESLNLTSLKADPKRWDQEWERVLDTLSAQKAYTRMGRLFKKGIWDKPGMTLERLTGYFTEDACKMQGVVLEIWRKDGLGEHLVTAWALLEYSEHERHLLEGLKEASERCPFHQDIRSLCPEIRTSLLLARSGRAFTDFVETFVEGKEAVGDVTIPYLFPSAWWNKAGDDMPESVLEEFDESSLTLLTLLRNDYIAQFLCHSLMSLFGDLMNGGSAINPIKKLMEEQPNFARILGKTIASRPEKPLIRCENCTKSPEDIGGNIEFMLCSACRTKLQFKVYYCSADCQKKDWPPHRKHCGKQRVSKKLVGTAQDPLWRFPELPESIRSNLTPNGIAMGETGFGPASAISSYSSVLQRQVALLRADREADYFLFDTHDRPIRFIVSDPIMKIMFRMQRAEALTPGSELGVAGMAEYMVKVMGQRPGLSQEGIFAQLQREYGGDIESQVARFKWAAAAKGWPEGTFMENMSKNLGSFLPEINQIYEAKMRDTGNGGHGA